MSLGAVCLLGAVLGAGAGVGCALQVKNERAKVVPEFPIEPAGALTLLTAAVALEL